jgi:hypothetical protein
MRETAADLSTCAVAGWHHIAESDRRLPRSILPSPAKPDCSARLPSHIAPQCSACMPRALLVRHARGLLIYALAASIFRNAISRAASQYASAPLDPGS